MRLTLPSHPVADRGDYAVQTAFFPTAVRALWLVLPKDGFTDVVGVHPPIA